MPQSASISDVTPAEKTQILHSILESRSLGRSDQLRRFLEYICRKESEGRGESITEYGIAVEALGRPPDFSVESDSIVRSRAHELRRRLDNYYQREGHADTIRISLPKGTYCPSFFRVPGAAEAPSPGAAAIPPPALEPTASLSRKGILLGATLGILLCAGVWWAAGAIRQWHFESSEDTRLLRQAWGPLLDSRTPVALVVANPTQLWVRKFSGVPTPLGDPPFLTPVPQDPQLFHWYRNTAEETPEDLFFHPNAHSPLWGDAAAATAATRLLAVWNVRTELLPERSIKASALKERNALLFGRADYSEAIAALQPSRGFRVEYSPDRRAVIVREQSGNGEAGRVFQRDPQAGGALNFGLITVLSRGPAGSPWRVMIFSGINSDGAHAGVDFLQSPARLRQLDEAFRAEGRSRWPASFQVVVHTQSTNTFTMDCGYTAHHVLED